MRKYLATLHRRSDGHKRRFAFATSGTITLIIFAFWGLANFGIPGTLAQEQEKKVKEVGPLDSIQASVGDSWDEIRGSFGDLQNKFRDFYNGGL